MKTLHYLAVCCLLSVLTLTGCDQRPRPHYKVIRKHVHTNTVEKVQIYRVHAAPAKTATQTADNSDNMWVYYYLIWNQNNSECVYASSSKPVSGSEFSTLTWQRSPSQPSAIKEAAESNQIEEEAPVIVSENDLGTQADSASTQVDPTTISETVSTDGGVDGTMSDAGAGDGGGDTGGGDAGGGDAGGDAGGGE